MENPEFKFPLDEPEQLIIKSQDRTDEKYGCEPEKRNVESLLQYGVINLDKPSGPTSHEVVSWVRKILRIENAGHGGTLDPKVTGILPCALGRATRVLSALLNAGKEYVGILYLHEEVNKKKIEKIFELFTDKIYQTPPIKSSVIRKLRIREIYYTKILESKDNHVLFKVGCEAGTYIRKLCFDIGEALCSGAHMLELRRTRVGDFREDESLVTLQNLKEISTDSSIQMKKEKLQRAFDNIDEIINDELLENQKRAQFIVKQNEAINHKFEDMQLFVKIKKHEQEIDNLTIDRNRITLSLRRELEGVEEKIASTSKSVEERIIEFTGKEIKLVF